MPTDSCRQTTNGKHNTLMKIPQPLADHLPPPLHIPLLHREGAPFHTSNTKHINISLKQLNSYANFHYYQVLNSCRRKGFACQMDIKNMSRSASHRGHIVV